jgi:arylsulfatase B
VADDLGVDKVGAYLVDVDPGYTDRAKAMPATPVLDSLASAGVRFTDAWANPACSPTRASLITGTYAFRHGVGQPIGMPGAQELSTDETTIAHVAGDAGYSTGLFGKWHLGQGELPETWDDDETWDDHLGEMVNIDVPAVLLGFNAFRGTRSDLEVGEFSGYFDWLRLTAVAKVGSFTVPTSETAYATVETTSAALGWINSQTGPWVASVNYHAPHTPLELPPEDCGYGNQSDLRKNLTHRAMVECLDQQVGELLTGVERLANTVVIFIGDNGTDDRVAEDIFDDGRGKGTLYESGIRIPFIVADGADWLVAEGKSTPAMTRKSPGVVTDPGREVADLVHVTDIYATLQDLTRSTTGGGQDSVSLVPFLEDTDGEIRDFSYSELYNATSGTAAYRDGTLKLLVTARVQDGAWCRARYELYDVLNDRFEQTDLAADQADLVSELKQKLDALVSTEPDAWLDVPDC